MVEQGWLYYVITNGGQVPSIVPAEAEVWYVGRSPSSDDLQSLWLCLNKVAEACHDDGNLGHYAAARRLLRHASKQGLNRVFAVNLRALAGALFIIEKFTKRWASC